MGRATRIRLLLALALPSVSCYVGLDRGASGGDDEGEESGDEGGDAGEPVDQGCGPASSRNVAKMSDREYANSVRALLGDPEFPIAVQSPGASPGAFFEDGTHATVGYGLAVQYQQAAEAAAVAVEAEPTRVGFGCGDAAADDPCVTEWIASFVGRARRLPLTDAEISAYADVFATGAEDGVAAGVGLVVEAVLQSPSFIYRRELGGEIDEDGATRLTEAELAERLAFWLTETIPDEELWQAALAGDLSDPEIVRAQVQRLQASEAGRRTLSAALVRWLRIPAVETLDKDPALFPDFVAVRGTLAESARLTIADAIAGEGDDVAALLTSPSAYVDDTIAPLFGLDAVGSSTLVPTDLPASERAGILTHPALLSALAGYDQTSLVKRGSLVRKTLLCVNMPPPPPGLDIDTPGEGLSPREFAEFRKNEPACSGCHSLMDPFGLVFESYDAVGHFRTSVDGEAIDASGMVTSTDFDGTYTSVPDLAQALANSEQFTQCVAQSMLTLSLANGSGDLACAVEGIAATFAEEGRELDELIVAIAMSETLRSRGE